MGVSAICDSKKRRRACRRCCGAFVTILFIGCASDAHWIQIWMRVRYAFDARRCICTGRLGANQTCMLYIMCIFKTSIQTKP
jgi:hypothetical protein